MKRSPLPRSCCSTYKSKEITGIFSMTIKTKRRTKKYTEITKRTVSEPVNVSAGVFGIPKWETPTVVMTLTAFSNPKLFLR